MTTGLVIQGMPYTGPVQSATTADPLAGGFACNDELLPPNPNVPSSTGLFTGSLSAHGNIVAMITNPGNYNYIDNNGFLAIKPYLSGYMREYWRNPSAMNLGANTAIPAITAVVPASFSGLSGNLLYYIDLQLTRLTGNNFFDNFTFINIFNQVLNWVTTSNDYLVALKNSDTKNLQYFGSANYQEFLTQGFSKYKIGNALRQSLANLGKIITEINEGHFGTSNSIASVMIKLGLGNIGNLTAKLTAADINLNNIYNQSYSQQISQILQTITNPNDLNTIQQVLKTNVANLRSPLDYTSIQLTSGLQNDSVFQNLIEFGKDIKNRTPFLTIETGQELVELIDLVLNEATNNVTNLSVDNKLLPTSIIDQLRGYLPIGKDNGPVTILDVIGMGSGYLTNDFKIVNENLLLIEQSSYGSQLHNALRDISVAWKSYTIDLKSARSEGNESATYFSEIEYNKKIADFNALVNAIAIDSQFKANVEQLNAAYLRICQSTYTEVTNFGRANFSTEVFKENTQIYSFVSNLPSLAVDTQNIATDTFLYNMCQSNEAGDIAKSILNQYKNTQSLSQAGVKITGTV
jgi:hypothetical protein